MKKFRFSIVIFALLFVSACSGRPGDGREGGTDKREWSILQVNEEKTRDTAMKSIEFHKLDDYNLICVPGKGVSKRIWIMMDAKSPPFYKQIPDGNFSLSEAQLAEIRQRTNPISTVIEALRSHVENN
jgi:hypothetical protein